MPYHPLISKHYHSDIYAEIFLEVLQGNNRFVKQMLTTDQGRLLLLDTVKHKNNERT